MKVKTPILLSLLCVIAGLNSLSAQTSQTAHAAGRIPAKAKAMPTAAPAVNEYAAIDEKALRMPDSSATTPESMAAYINASFKSDREKARAAFIWIATNIQYDIGNMFALNFYETREEKVAKALKSRKGICANYAALFNAICSKAGIRCYEVEGYTKQNGFTDYIPHAWCIAYVDTDWYIFDPTWGSGYVSNAKFIPKVNNYYFMTRPSDIIHSHMPFDYLWQCLYYPVTNQQFYEGKVAEDKTTPYFNFPDSISSYEKLEKTDAYADEARRIEKNGVKNSMIFDRLQHLRREVEVERQNERVGFYNSAITDYNRSTSDFNAYIDYYNKQFKPVKPDTAIREMLNTAAGHLKAAASKLDQIKQPDAATANMIASFRKQIGDLSAHVDEQQAWLDKYFAKGKMGRKMMFTKYTWFGVPLN